MQIPALSNARSTCACTAPGFELLPHVLNTALRLLETPGVTAVTGPVIFRSADGTQARQWRATALTIPLVFADPRGIPPVWIARTEGPEPRERRLTDPFEAAAAWVRCLQRGAGRVAVLDEPVAERSLTMPSQWEALLRGSDYARRFRDFLEAHHDLVAEHITEIFILRETAFACLRAEHAALVRRNEDAAREIAAAAASPSRQESITWGSFDRTSPISRDWGYGRGGPVDRRYIRDFIATHCSDIHGHVLEVQEDDLTRSFGGVRVEACDVLDKRAENTRATVFADLRDAHGIRENYYDCIVLTQTAHLIDDVGAVVRECHRILKPGGVLLATFPALSRLCLEYEVDGDFWRMTPAGARVLLSTAFEQIDVEMFGNIKTAVAFLHGLGERELSDSDYAVTDPYHPMLVAARARKRIGPLPVTGARGLILTYHCIEPERHDPFKLNVPPSEFEEHLSWLQDNASLVSLEDLLTQAPEDLPPDAVALTFDDGYDHHLSYVAPLLASRAIPATYFLTTAGFEAPHEYWWDLLERAELSGSERAAVHDRFVHAAPHERAQLTNELTAQLGRTVSRPLRRPLLVDEVRRLAALPGVSFGAHGIEHLHLPDQLDDVRRAELRASRLALEEVISRRVHFFAYPYGGVDDVTASMARQEFRWALTCQASPVRQSFDAARVPRLDVKRWTVQELGASIANVRSSIVQAAPVRLLP